MVTSAHKEFLLIILGAILGVLGGVIMTSIVASSINKLDEYEMRMLAVAEHIRSGIENEVTSSIAADDCVLATSSGHSGPGKKTKYLEFRCSAVIDGREFFTLTAVSQNGFEYGTWDWSDE